LEDSDLKALSESPSEKVTLHLDVERFQTLDMRRREVSPERSSLNSMGGFFDPIENIRGPSEMNKMRERILLRSARKPDIDFDDVWFGFGGNEKNRFQDIGMERGAPSLHGREPKRNVSRTLCICRWLRVFWRPS